MLYDQPYERSSEQTATPGAGQDQASISAPINEKASATGTPRKRILSSSGSDPSDRIPAARSNDNLKRSFFVVFSLALSGPVKYRVSDNQNRDPFKLTAKGQKEKS
jgi:hypothetical protein